MRRILTVQQRQQILQDLISGKRSVVELGDETRMLILSDIIASMRNILYLHPFLAPLP